MKCAKTTCDSIFLAPVNLVRSAHPNYLRTLSTPLPFAEHRKGDWISDVKSNKSRRRSAHSKNDRLRSAPLLPSCRLHARVESRRLSGARPSTRCAHRRRCCRAQHLQRHCERQKDDRPGLDACLKAAYVPDTVVERRREAVGRARRARPGLGRQRDLHDRRAARARRPRGRRGHARPAHERRADRSAGAGAGRYTARPGVCRSTWPPRGRARSSWPGRVADGVIAGMGLTPDVIRLSLEAIERGARASGRTLADLDVWWFARTNVADTRRGPSRRSGWPWPRAPTTPSASPSRARRCPPTFTSACGACSASTTRITTRSPAPAMPASPIAGGLPRRPLRHRRHAGRLRRPDRRAMGAGARQFITTGFVPDPRGFMRRMGEVAPAVELNRVHRAR